MTNSPEYFLKVLGELSQMFVLAASVEVVVHQPVAFSKVLEHSLVEIECPFCSLHYLKDSCESVINQLLVIVLRNRVISVALKMLSFLRAVEE